MLTVRLYLKGSASILPPMISTNSVVSFISGSNAMLPPGELSNINPKSRIIRKLMLINKDINIYKSKIIQCF